MTAGTGLRIPEDERDQARAAIENAMAQHDIRFLVILLHVFEDAIQYVDKTARDVLVLEAIGIYQELYPDGVHSQPNPVSVPTFRTV